MVASPLSDSSSVGFGANRHRMTYLAVISPTAVHFWESDLLCAMISQANIFFLFLVSIIHNIWPWQCGLNIPQLAHQLHYTFWMCHQIHNALCYDSHEWWNNNFPHHVDFTLHPFKIILRNVQALHNIPFWNYSVKVYLFPGIPSLMQFFLSHSSDQMIYDLDTYLHRYPLPIFVIWND